jgi:hypothetical protein
VNRELLAADARQTARALDLLDQQLADITKVVPKAAVAKLQKVPLYFNPEYPGVRPSAEYHPGADWLRKNGRDPAMARGVEFTNVRMYPAEVNRMPWFVLHELAHGFHDRELPKGFANPEVAAAYARAKESGTYDKVERHFGNGRPNTVEKAYALTNPMEYFAEATEAYFGRNDFFPFTHADLKTHDPAVFELLGKLWQVTADPAPPTAPPPLTQQLPTKGPRVATVTAGLVTSRRVGRRNRPGRSRQCRPRRCTTPGHRPGRRPRSAGCPRPGYRRPGRTRAPRRRRPCGP